MSPLETSITSTILKRLRNRGVEIIKVHVTAYMRTGEPDLLGCLPPSGRTVALEVKQPGKKATPVQQMRLMMWEKAGAITGTVHSADEAEMLVFGDLQN